MPSFASNTVHGLSADVYYNGNAVRVFGAISVGVDQQTLPLTANDEGNINPVDVLRRGENFTVSVPVSDTSGIPTLSGVVFPFSTLTASGLIIPKAAPGDSFVSVAKELRLVLRDGSATIVFFKAAVTEVEDFSLDEENQQVLNVTFSTFRETISGEETPLMVISGSVVTGGY